MRSVAGRPLASTRNPPSIPTLRAGRLAAPGGSRRGLINLLVNEKRRGSAASVDSQFPVDPRYAGRLATPGGSRRGLLNPLMNEKRRGSAASVDSQSPVDPRYAGRLATPGGSRR